MAARMSGHMGESSDHSLPEVEGILISAVVFQAVITFNLDADLRSVFSWNAKQVCGVTYRSKTLGWGCLFQTWLRRPVPYP